ncbi:uncharacterized protein [Leuresthes tenuis]|uniref:uncharacterized protein n=1 Tax=Leuresthes tenuis TaxID=355514 RepID=UPI003B50C366
MYTKCRESGLRVRKEDARLELKELDPRGVALRKGGRLRGRRYFSKGPNFIWHMDSYDKLKPYGFCINGSIDGFSRKIMWLNAYTTNSDPKLIGGYYTEAVERFGGCPRIVRGDLGTENDRGQCVEFWLPLFSDLRDNGFFDGGFLDKAILQFCCMGLIQDELDDTAQVWNAHTIRPSKNTSGQPNVMSALPQLCGTRDFLSPVEDEHLQLCKDECVFRVPIPCDPDVYELCHIFMAESHLTLPTDPYQTVSLYLHLREAITASL